MRLLRDVRALLLDMNSTFMFGEDRFGAGEDFSRHYRQIGGQLPSGVVDRIIRAAYGYLDVRYPDPTYRERFPSLDSAVRRFSDARLDEAEHDKLIRTFAYHELGHIPSDYVDAIKLLSDKFVLGAVIDIWSPKAAWLRLFEQVGILDCFSALSFSSDSGIVKPSPKPFLSVLKQLDVANHDALVIGDSVRRDLGGATAAGLACVLVGGANDERARGTVDNLLKFVREEDIG